MSEITWRQQFNTLAAQVRRLGIVADVQIGDEIAFGNGYDEAQVRAAVLATVATLNRLVLENSNVPTCNGRGRTFTGFNLDEYFNTTPTDEHIERLKVLGYKVEQSELGFRPLSRLGLPLMNAWLTPERSAWRYCAIDHDQHEAKNR